MTLIYASSAHRMYPATLSRSVTRLPATSLATAQSRVVVSGDRAQVDAGLCGAEVGGHAGGRRDAADVDGQRSNARRQHLGVIDDPNAADPNTRAPRLLNVPVSPRPRGRRARRAVPRGCCCWKVPAVRQPAPERRAVSRGRRRCRSRLLLLLRFEVGGGALERQHRVRGLWWCEGRRCRPARSSS